MNKTFVTILILIVVVVGGYFLLRGGDVQAPAGDTSETSGMPVSNTETPETVVDTTSTKPVEIVVTYTDAGYSPSTINVKLGTTVTWVNDSSISMWTASAVHPSHTAYSGTALQAHCPDTTGTAFDACAGVAPGASWSFTFNKAGSWKYHNHLKASDFGTVVVE